VSYDFKFEIGERVCWKQNKDTVFVAKIVGKAMALDGKNIPVVKYTCRKTDPGHSLPTNYTCKEDILHRSFAELEDEMFSTREEE